MGNPSLYPGNLVLGEQMFQPQICKMLVQASLRKPLLQAVVVGQVEGLVLPGAGEYGLGAFAGGGFLMQFHAVRANFIACLSTALIISCIAATSPFSK